MPLLSPIKLPTQRKPSFDLSELNSPGFGGTLADYLLPMSVGGQRIGRAATLQAAAGDKHEGRPKWARSEPRILQTRKKPEFDPAELNSEGVGGMLADFLLPDSIGGQRAGRAATLEQAMTGSNSFQLRHPIMTAILSGLVGAGTGAVAGVGAGKLLDKFKPRTPLPSGEFDTRPDRGREGGVYGAVGGALAGLLMEAYSRHKKIRGVNDQYRAYKGDVTPVVDRGSAPVFNPAYWMGQAEALRALRTGKPKTAPPADLLATQALSVPIALSLPYVGAPFPISVGMAGGLNIANISSRIRTLDSGARAMDAEVAQDTKARNKEKAASEQDPLYVRHPWALIGAALGGGLASAGVVGGLNLIHDYRRKKREAAEQAAKKASTGGWVDYQQQSHAGRLSPMGGRHWVR